MIKPDTPTYKLDLTGTSIFNKRDREYGMRTVVKHNHMFIPQCAPFYQESVKMYRDNGQPMVLDKDYEFYGIMSKLTEFTAKPVGLYIRLLDDTITGWYIDYQVVGNFNKITDDILQMLKNISEDDRPVDWGNIENKPLWFVPELHQHDWTYEFFGFEDLANVLKEISVSIGTVPSALAMSLDVFAERLAVYIEGHRKVLLNLLKSHADGRVDNHGVNKKHIGLDKVDNEREATYEEALAGDSDKLRLTPGIAAKVAELASTRNQRLFPSGSLPLLRYGNDSFLPPSVAGSFEGMGGNMFHACAVLENNGTLMMITPRDNGVTKGLYYETTQGTDPTKAKWVFTGQRYSHPQAVADGANLNHVLNGSNDKIMVVGDFEKNIWYWVETNGSLNPDRHVYHRITGGFTTASTQAQRRSIVAADSNFERSFIIIQPFTLDEVRTIRPNWADGIFQRGGNHTYEGYRFFVVFNLTGNLNKAVVSFKEQDGVTPGDELWIPRKRIEGTIDGVTGIVEYHVKYTKPVNTVWDYGGMEFNTVYGPQGRRLRLQTRVYSIDMNGQSLAGGTVAWKGTIDIADRGVTAPLVSITPAPNQKLYPFNPDYTALDSVNYENAKFLYIRNGSEINSGFARFGNDNLMVLTYPAVGVVVPQTNQIVDATRRSDYEQLFTVTEFDEDPNINRPTINTNWLYDLNPIGLGSGFLNPVSLLADTSNPLSGVVMVRQLQLDGGAVYVCRKTPFLDANWNASVSTVVPLSIGGKTVSSFPLSNETYKSNLGIKVIACNHGFGSIPTGVGAPAYKDRWTRMLGCDSSTHITGDIDLPGDWKYPKVVHTSIENGTVKFQPKIVFNMEHIIKGVVKTFLQSKGWSMNKFGDAWVLSPGFTRAGIEFQLLQFSYRDGTGPATAPVKTCAIIIQVQETGPTQQIDGYTYYTQPGATILPGFVEWVSFTASIGEVVQGTQVILRPNGMGYTDHNNTTPSTTCMLVRPVYYYPVTGDRVQPTSLFEIAEDLSFTKARNFAHSSLGQDTGPTFCPGRSLGIATPVARDMTKGAGVVCQMLNMPGSRYDALVAASVTEEYWMPFSNMLSSQYVVYFNEMKGVILGGKTYDVDSTYIDIRDFDPSPANKKFYIYLRYAAGKAVYEVSSSIHPETSISGMIATVQCGPVQIDTIVPYNRFTMDGAQISSNRKGSSIMATGGSIYEPGNTGAIFDPSTDLVP